MIFHPTPDHHLSKLRRIVERLEKQEMHADDMDDFCKTAWHLIELVEKNHRSTQAQRQAASRLRSDPDLLLCQYGATMEKHGESKPKVADRAGLADVEVLTGYGAGGFGRGSFGHGEHGITFRFKNGAERTGLEFASTVLQKWEAVFALG
jgi:hypothetical protein